MLVNALWYLAMFLCGVTTGAVVCKGISSGMSGGMRE